MTKVMCGRHNKEMFVEVHGPGGIEMTLHGCPECLRERGLNEKKLVEALEGALDNLPPDRAKFVRELIAGAKHWHIG